MSDENRLPDAGRVPAGASASSAESREEPGLLHRAKRSLAVALCVVLAVAVACMAVAVLLQAVAVLLVAALAATLLLPHPLKWYAREGAEAVKLFVHELFGQYIKKEGE
jgi:Flp pilus assembly protein TadB